MSLVIRKMEIKTTMIYQSIPARLIKIKRLTIPSVGEDVERLEFLYIARGSVKVPATSANSWIHLIKLNICTYPMTQQVPLYPKEMKPYVHKKNLLKNAHSSFIHNSSKL